MKSLVHEPTAEKGADLTEFFAAAHRARVLATTAKAALEAATPLLIQAIASGTGQGRRLERLLWSAWNGGHKTGLCDDLTGLDSAVAQAALSMLAARAHLSGDADPLLRKIIDDSGTQPPENHPLEK